MDITLKDIKHVHCLGIGGIGLSAVAEIFKSRGIAVSGSDIKESELTDRLEKQGIRVFIGHSAENIGDADVLVFSAAVSEENPEIMRARENNIPVISRAQALGLLMDDYPVSLAIAGTHGKTTTTSMVSLILNRAKLDPTILVGGILKEIGGNARVGKGDYFVTEACEYMNSFLSLKPYMEIILNIDSDHLDYFTDINHIARSFRTFAETVPNAGCVIAYDSNPFVNSIADDLSCRVVRFGFNSSSDYFAKNIDFDEFGMPGYDLYTKEGFVSRMQLSIPGEHNVSNSLAAIAACSVLGVDFDVIKETLEGFSGTQRRFDILGKTNKGLMVIDDYAHHPTEIRATLSGAENIPHKKMWVCFQPHTYTRTLALMDQFADAFEQADELVLAEIFAAREKNIYKLSSEKLCELIRERHPDKKVHFFSTFEGIADFVMENAEPGDMVITMGAGDIYKVGELIIERQGKA